MATRKNTFLLKRSNVAGNVPAAGQILLGELALNTADVKLYTSGTTANSILPIGWDRVSRTGDTMTGTLIVPTLSATTLTALNISGTTNYVAKFTTNGTSLGNSQIFDNGTNVGIVTSTPNSRLEVNGNMIVGTGNKSIGSWPFFISDSSNLGWKVADSSGAAKFELYVGNAGINQMRLLGGVSIVGFSQNLSLGTSAYLNTINISNTNGNVGIETIDPQAKLHVSGNTIISGDLTATTISATSIDQVNFVDINTGVTITSDAGRISWNDIDGTFNMGLYQGVSLQLGQEENMYGKAISGISNGDVVMFAGVQGDHVLFAKADPSVINQKPQYIIGVATQNFIANQFGYVTILGKVRNLNTSAYSDGAILYFNSTGSTLGGFTSVEPTAPNAKIIVAAVLRSHATQGVILVRPTFSRRVSDIQDVQITNIQNNDIIQYSSSLGYFVNTNTPKFSSVSATTMSAVTFTGNLTGLASLATSATTALNSTQLNGQSASYYYPSSNPSGYTTNTGTVTGVNSGNGMNFTNFTTSGTITLGTPSSLTLSSTNSVTTNSHTHAFAPGGTTAQYITGAGTLATFPTIVNTFVTGATFNSSNNNLTLTRNDGVNIVANLNISTTDVYVTGGTYSNGTATFKNNTGGTFNVTGFPTGATTAVSFTQTLPATGWTFTHNLGTDKPMITVYNSNNQVIIPQEITAISSSTLYITFPVPVAGYVIAGGGVVTQQTEEISIITAIIFG